MAVQLGLRVLALAAEMKRRLSVSYGKLRAFFASAWQVEISRATFARADQRLVQRLEPTYGALILSIRQKQVVYGDETGWKIRGRNAWLWVFTEIAVYIIDGSRDHKVVERVLGVEGGESQPPVEEQCNEPEKKGKDAPDHSSYWAGRAAGDAVRETWPTR